MRSARSEGQRLQILFDRSIAYAVLRSQLLDALVSSRSRRHALRRERPATRLGVIGVLGRAELTARPSAAIAHGTGSGSKMLETGSRLADGADTHDPPGLGVFHSLRRGHREEQRLQGLGHVGDHLRDGIGSHGLAYEVSLQANRRIAEQ
jgi:hypothetical protein